MFSYIYADDRGLNYFIAARTENGAKRAAFEYIRNLATGEVPYDKITKPETIEPCELKAVFDALTSQDMVRLIEAWNIYNTIVKQVTISCHQIKQITFVE